MNELFTPLFNWKANTLLRVFAKQISYCIIYYFLFMCFFLLIFWRRSQSANSILLKIVAFFAHKWAFFIICKDHHPEIHPVEKFW